MTHFLPVGTPVATVLQNLILCSSAVTSGAKLEVSLFLRYKTLSTGGREDIFDDAALHRKETKYCKNIF